MDKTWIFRPFDMHRLNFLCVEWKNCWTQKISNHRQINSHVLCSCNFRIWVLLFYGMPLSRERDKFGHNCWNHFWRSIHILKFMFSKKATKIDKIFAVDLTLFCLISAAMMSWVQRSVELVVYQQIQIFLSYLQKIAKSFSKFLLFPFS